MFEFEANLLKKAYTFARMRLPQAIAFPQGVVKKIEGVAKHHSHGDLPIEVVVNSLKGQNITVIPKGPANDVQILSIGTVIDGMLDGPPDDPSSKPLLVGSKIYILIPILMLSKERFIAKTTYRILLGKYTELKGKELSLDAWAKLYKEKIGLTWELSEREKERLKKNGSKTLKNGYNNVSGDQMELTLGNDIQVLSTDEELVEMLRAEGKTEAEIKQFMLDLNDTTAEDAENEAYWNEIKAAGLSRN